MTLDMRRLFCLEFNNGPLTFLITIKQFYVVRVNVSTVFSALTPVSEGG
jgi:hypothetical protein